MKLSFSILLFLGTLINLHGQRGNIDPGAWNNPRLPSQGAVTPRSEFISYDIRELAEKDDYTNNQYYVALEMKEVAAEDGNVKYESLIDVPYIWLDRDIFLQIEGVESYYLYVRDQLCGYGEDSRTPNQFNISNYVKDGENKISVQAVKGTGIFMETGLDNRFLIPKFTLFSQPKIRIEDYTIRFQPDSTDTHGVLEIEIALSNSYNSNEEVTIGYDIYSPQRLEYYNMTSVEVPGQGRDTVRFKQAIYRTDKFRWSETNSSLYHGMLTVKRGTRMTEYVPYKVGFGETAFSNGVIYRNEGKIDIKAARYNTIGDRKVVTQQIKLLKSNGINTVITNYPQPIWFYDICDESGMYVIEQANINSNFETDNRRVGGALSNDPEWLETFYYRTKAMYERVKNHTCIIGWSLGGKVGNGYNMYKTYQMLKDYDKERVIIFLDNDGEWNSDTGLDSIKEAAEIFSIPATNTKSTSRR